MMKIVFMSIATSMDMSTMSIGMGEMVRRRIYILMSMNMGDMNISITDIIITIIAIKEAKQYWKLRT